RKNSNRGCAAGLRTQPAHGERPRATEPSAGFGSIVYFGWALSMWIGKYALMSLASVGCVLAQTSPQQAEPNKPLLDFTFPRRGFPSPPPKNGFIQPFTSSAETRSRDLISPRTPWNLLRDRQNQPQPCSI